MFPQEVAVDWQLDKEVWATFSQDKLICFAFFFFTFPLPPCFHTITVCLLQKMEPVLKMWTVLCCPFILKKKKASFLTLSCVLVVCKRN